MNKQKRYTLIIWCIIISLMLPITLPILASADMGSTLIKTGDTSHEVSLEPYENDLGLMVKASDIAEAFCYDYTFDAENKSFEIIVGAYGKVTLMHNATKFYSGEHEFECLPYFYVENGAPMVEVGFFCEMFNSSYEYDEANKTIEIFVDVPRYTLADDTEDIIASDSENQNRVSLFAAGNTRNVSGKVKLPNGFEHKTAVKVKLTVKPYKQEPGTSWSPYGGSHTVWYTYYGTDIDLGEVSIPGNSDSQDYSISFKATDEMSSFSYPYYKVLCAVTKDDSRKLSRSEYSSSGFSHDKDAKADFTLSELGGGDTPDTYEDYYQKNKSYSFKIRDIEKMKYSDTNIFNIEKLDYDESWTTDNKGYAKIPYETYRTYKISANGYMPLIVPYELINKHFYNKFVMYKTSYSDKPEVHAAFHGSKNVFKNDSDSIIYSGDALTKSTITAVINSNGKTISEVKIVQGKNSVAAQSYNDYDAGEIAGKEYKTEIWKTDSFNPGMELSEIGEPIYMIIKTAEGDETKVLLDIKCVEQAKQEVPIDMGDEISFSSVETENSFLGDMNFNYDFFDKLPASLKLTPVSKGHYTFKGTLGVDALESEMEEKSYKTVKDAFAAASRETYLANNYDGKNAAQKFDNYFRKLADQNLTSMDMLPSVEFGFKPKLVLFGYAEGSFDLQNDGFYDMNFSEGGLSAKLSFDFEKKRQKIWVTPHGPVPVYYKLGLEVADGIVVPLVGKDGKLVIPDYVKNEFEITATGGGGAGIVDLVTVGASVEGKLAVTCTIPLSKEQTQVIVNGKLHLFDYELGTLAGSIFTFPTKDLQLYPEVEVIDPKQAELNEAEQLSRDYTVSPMSFNPQTVELMSADAETETSPVAKTTIAENTYTFSNPTIISVPGTEDEMVMAWVEDERSRESNADRTAIYYSRYDGAQWSEPQIVYDDEKADFNPCLKSVGDSIYLCWSNASENFASDENDVTKIAKSLVTSIAKWNGTSFEMLPQIENKGVILADICEINGEPNLVWTESTSGDIQQNAGDTALKQAVMKNGEWSSDTLLSNQKSIDGLSVSDIDGEVNIFYSQDTDGDISTAEDKEIFTYADGKAEQITKNNIADTKPQVSGDTLYWYSGGDIAFSKTNDLSNTESLGINMMSDKFNVIENETKKAITYYQTDEEGKQNVYAVYHDGKGWCMPISIASTDNLIGGYKSLMTADSKIRIVANEITTDENELTKADINLYEVGSYADITLESVEYNEYSTSTYPEFYFTLTNNGTEEVGSVIITAYDENGQKIDYTYQSIAALIPGETYSYKTNGLRIANNSNIRFEVLPCDENYNNMEDVNTEDNSLTLEYKNDDVSVEEVSVEQQDDKALISAYIVNRGQNDLSNINVSLRKDTAQGEVINSTVIDTIECNDHNLVEFEVNSADTGIYYITCDELENEKLPGNNSGFTMLADDITQEDLILTPCFTVEYKDGYADVTNTGDKKEKVAVIVADYNNEALKNISSQRLEFEAGETRQFPLSGDNSKVFVWNSLRGMFPMTK